LVLSKRNGTVLVSVVGAERKGEARSLLVMAQFRQDDARLGAARRVMRANGFDGGKPSQPWFGIKDARNVSSARREADRIFGLLRAL